MVKRNSFLSKNVSSSFRLKFVISYFNLNMNTLHGEMKLKPNKKCFFEFSSKIRSFSLQFERNQLTWSTLALKTVLFNEVLVFWKWWLKVCKVIERYPISQSMEKDVYWYRNLFFTFRSWTTTKDRWNKWLFPLVGYFKQP